MAALLHELLIESAGRGPDKTAAVCGDESISYGELDRLSNGLAAILRQNGIERGDRVGFFMPKAVASIVAIHGIMKAGAAYVPIDPDSPAARLSYILHNCAIKCLITSHKKRRVLEQVFSGSSTVERVIFVDDAGGSPLAVPVPTISWAQVVDADGPGEPVAMTQDDLAYILYTSGSTGSPKGVMISHLNAMTFVEWATRVIGVRESDRVSNHAPFHFDLSIFDIYTTFNTGGTLVIVPPGLSVFPYRLGEWIDQQKISVWYSVPSILSMLVRQGELERFDYDSLRSIVFAGEVFPAKYLGELMKKLPRPSYFNLYGPTETNVITYYKAKPEDGERDTPIPIGIACEGYDVFAVTDGGTVVAREGERGELYAAGPCVARGYWGDEEKTKTHFVADPRGQSGGRVYKTGDYVALAGDGNFEFLGRRDHMVKSRGYRIELGEIEHALYSHPKVDEVAVIAVPDEMIGNRIKAFVALKNNNVVEPSELQSHCGERIPKYMVPESIEFRKTLPKTSTGKVDRQALAGEDTGAG